jgi:hypothetical protein
MHTPHCMHTTQFSPNVSDAHVSLPPTCVYQFSPNVSDAHVSLPATCVYQFSPNVSDAHVSLPPTCVYQFSPNVSDAHVSLPPTCVYQFSPNVSDAHVSLPPTCVYQEMTCEASKGPWMSLSGSSYSQHLGRDALGAEDTGLPKPGAGPCREGWGGRRWGVGGRGGVL